jgi:hypothetical protein
VTLLGMEKPTRSAGLSAANAYPVESQASRENQGHRMGDMVMVVVAPFSGYHAIQTVLVQRSGHRGALEIPTWPLPLEPGILAR